MSERREASFRMNSNGFNGCGQLQPLVSKRPGHLSGSMRFVNSVYSALADPTTLTIRGLCSECKS